MRIEVRFRGIAPSEALRGHALRQLHFHLSRFGRQVSAAVVRLDDVNGEKGGVDKRCRITLRGPRFGSLTLDELSADVQAAIDVAADRVGHALGRQLERERRGKARTLGPAGRGT